MRLLATLTCAIAGAMLTGNCAWAQDQDVDAMAKQLSNPVANVVSVPFVFDFDYGAGPNDNGSSYLLKVQPVIPFQLDANWNVISRTIVPLSFQTGIYANDVAGLGDVSQTFFVTPAKPGELVWGVGPAFLIPTATDPALGSGKFGIGPSVLLLKQQGPWSYGILASHIWSVAGDPGRDDVSKTALQPFINLSIGGGQTLSANLEAGYDWTHDQWSVPLNLDYSKVFKVDGQTLKWTIGGRAHLVGPDNGPDWGLRTGVTFVLPPG